MTLPMPFSRSVCAGQIHRYPPRYPHTRLSLPRYAASCLCIGVRLPVLGAGDRTHDAGVESCRVGARQRATLREPGPRSGTLPNDRGVWFVVWFDAGNRRLSESGGGRDSDISPMKRRDALGGSRLSHKDGVQGVAGSNPAVSISYERGYPFGYPFLQRMGAGLRERAASRSSVKAGLEKAMRQHGRGSGPLSWGLSSRYRRRRRARPLTHSRQVSRG